MDRYVLSACRAMLRGGDACALARAGSGISSPRASRPRRAPGQHRRQQRRRGARCHRDHHRSRHQHLSTTVTNENGAYTFPNLKDGLYRVAAELTGFKKVVRENVQVDVNTTIRVDFALEAGRSGRRR